MPAAPPESVNAACNIPWSCKYQAPVTHVTTAPHLNQTSAKGATYNSNKWDGTHEGNPLPVGTYYYTINQNDGSDLQSGSVTIVR